MDLRELHPWRVTPEEAMRIQRELAAQVVAQGGPREVRTVAGADIAVGRRDARIGRGAVVVLSYPDLRVLEQVVVEAEVTFPYIPGLLAFREVPVLAEAFRKIGQRPDLLLVDGQGLAHQRRFGIACHLGLLLDMPTIGCAKSPLVGQHGTLGEEAGSRTPLVDKGEAVGMVLRTRRGVNPLYVSVGHRIGLEEAADWVVRLCRGYRLPEPTRLADQAAGGHLPAPAKAQPSPDQLSLL